MRIERLTIALLTVTVLLQGASFYQQWSRRPVNRPSLQDVKPGTFVDLKGLPSRGRVNAKVALLEFSDYECPYCARHTKTVGNDITKRFIETGQIKHVFVNNPLAIHPQARFLAVSSLCAGKENEFWEMHDAIFGRAAKTRPDILSIGSTLNLDKGLFEGCLDNDDELQTEISRESAIATQLGLTATPGFAIGTVSDDGQRLEVHKLILGAQRIEVFVQAIGDLARVSSK